MVSFECSLAMRWCYSLIARTVLAPDQSKRVQVPSLLPDRRRRADLNSIRTLTPDARSPRSTCDTFIRPTRSEAPHPAYPRLRAIRASPSRSVWHERKRSSRPRRRRATGTTTGSRKVTAPARRRAAEGRRSGGRSDRLLSLEEDRSHRLVSCGRERCRVADDSPGRSDELKQSGRI